MTFITKFYLYKCSHCLGSHECPSSCKSQKCWYSSHICDSHDFHSSLRSMPLEVVSARKRGTPPVFFLLPNTSQRLLRRFTSILAFINFWRKQNIKLLKKLNYLQKNEVKAWIVNYTITNAPISCVARPTSAVVRARNVGTVGIYVTIMASILAFINFWREQKILSYKDNITIYLQEQEVKAWVANYKCSHFLCSQACTCSI